MRSCFNVLEDTMSLNYLQPLFPHLLNEYPNSHTQSVQSNMKLSPIFNISSALLIDRDIHILQPSALGMWELFWWPHCIRRVEGNYIARSWF